MYGDALTTKENIKDRLGITVTTFDALIDRLILSVTARIEQMCGRRFTLAEFTNELHDGSDPYGTPRKALVVKNAPIQSVATIEYMAGTPSTPNWTAFYSGDYQVDYDAGIIYFPYCGLPRGYRNVRITYTGGYAGYSQTSSLWHFNVQAPDLVGAVDGSNLTFQLPANADQVVVYPDGTRESAANVTFTPGTDTFTLAAGRAPTTTMAVDYLETSATGGTGSSLPADLVEVAEEAVSRIFKKRESEGRDAESFDQSSITWSKSVFTDENIATIKNYRRGYNL
jgi:hypothetical protein